MGEAITTSNIARATGSNRKQHKDITKRERYIEMLLLAGPAGLPSVEVAINLPTSCASTYVNQLRKYIDVASVPNHALIDARQAINALGHLDKLRLKRGAELYPANVLKAWF